MNMTNCERLTRLNVAKEILDGVQSDLCNDINIERGDTMDEVLDELTSITIKLNKLIYLTKDIIKQEGNNKE